MTKGRQHKPDRFGEGGAFSKDEEAVDDAALREALRRFVGAFVIKSKQDRVQTFLQGRREQRLEVLQHLPSWVIPELQTELDGNQGFPQHLQERFGSLRGVLIDDQAARRMTIAGAMWATTMRGSAGALFVSDSGAVALLVPEDGPPTLCLRKA